MSDPVGYLTLEQYRKVLKSLKRYTREWLLIFLLYRTGRRISELLELKPMNIQADKKLIDWKILKKGEGYRALKPIDSNTLRALLDYIERNEIAIDKYIFESQSIRREGFPYSRIWAYWKVRTICQKALSSEKIGNKYPHPHHFRHSFAINYVERSDTGESIKQLQDHLGHSDISTTAFYLQFSQKKNIEALEKVMSGLDDEENEPEIEHTVIPNQEDNGKGYNPNRYRMVEE